MAKVRLGKFEVDQAELDQQIAAATERGNEELRRQPLATRVRYDRRTKRVVLTLNNGAQLEIPVGRLQGLASATDAELAKVRILGPGTAVEWTTLDQQFSVVGLLAGVFGSRTWMAKRSQRGGKSMSPAKPTAARKNVDKKNVDKKNVDKKNVDKKNVDKKNVGKRVRPRRQPAMRR
jgi:Protein of unknown function (DUF2442)